MASLLDKIKNFFGPYVTPLFVVDDSPPPLGNDTTVPAQIDRTTGGVKVHVANAADIGSGGGSGGATETTAADILSNVESLDDKTLPILGTTLNVQTGTATTTSTQFASANYARGFVIANLSTTVTIWVYQGVATVSNGWPIFPESIQAFELPDPSVLQHITQTGTASFRVGAIT